MLELNNLSELTVSSILSALDLASSKYTIEKNSTELITSTQDIPELVKYYLVCKKVSGLAEGTLENYLYICRLFFQIVGKSPEDVTSNDIRVFLYHYQTTYKVSSRTLDKYREVICRFFHWAHRETYISKNPASNIGPIKYQSKPREPLTQVDLEHLRRACQRPRDIAILETFYSTGCRLSELCNIKLSDIDWDSKTVCIFGKGQKYRYSFLNAKAEVALKEYLNSRTDNNEYLFVSDRAPYGQMHKCGIQKIIRGIAERSGSNINKRVIPHVIRHTTATRMLENKADITSIQTILGHSNINTTMIYAYNTLENVKLEHRKAVV